MQRVEVTHRFAAPVERVWALYTDHGGWSRWSGLGSSRLEREGVPDRDGTGAVRRLGDGLAAVSEEILDWEPPKRFTYRLIRGPLPVRDHVGEVIFEPDGDGTFVIWRCRFDAMIPGLGGLFRLAITRVFRRALAGLERALAA